MQTHRLISLVVVLVAGIFATQAAYTDDLVPLPAHPSYMEWPGETWPPVHGSEGFSKVELNARIAKAFTTHAPPALQGVRAVVVIRAGGLAAEAYDEGFDPDTKLVSWSMAKSFTHAIAGLMVKDGKISLSTRLPVPEWQGGPDPRAAITLDHALRMSSGLAFSEDYENLATSDVINMLFGKGYQDMGGFAASKPLAHEPGTHWSYSSGTTNLISRVMRDLSGGTEQSYRTFLNTRLFGPLGVSAVPEFDAAGTLIGSSLIFMSARDYARFGLLYMRDGVWRDEHLLPEGWVDHARTPTPASNGYYGAHWWLRFTPVPDRVKSAHIAYPRGSFMARGHEGQSLIVVPSKDVVVVCLSLTTEYDISEVQDYLAGIISVFPDIDRRRGEGVEEPSEE